MNLSEKKRSELYTAIHEPIMKMRVSVRQSESVLGHKNAKDLDEVLYRLNNIIWVEVKKTLNISDT